jgi:hypothetical protein
MSISILFVSISSLPNDEWQVWEVSRVANQYGSRLAEAIKSGIIFKDREGDYWYAGMVVMPSYADMQDRVRSQWGFFTIVHV